MYHGTNMEASRRDDRLPIHPLCCEKQGELRSPAQARAPVPTC